MTVESLQSIAALVWSYPGVQVICLGVILNLIFAVAVAIRTGSFSFRVLGDFLWKQLTPYVIVYFAASLFAEALSTAPGMEWAKAISPVTFALLMATIGGSIIEKLKALGVPIPESVLKLFASAEDATWHMWQWEDRQEDKAAENDPTR